MIDAICARIVRRQLKKVPSSQLTSPERLRHNSFPGKYVHDERVLAQPMTSERRPPDFRSAT
jgi:hypothetical protein